MRTSERHSLKQDAFAVKAKETYSWAADHKNKLVIALVVIVAAIAIFYGLRAWNESRNATASVELGAAMAVYEAPIAPAGAPAEPNQQTFPSIAERAKAAHAKFEAVAQQYGSTASGRAARYMAGVTAITLGDNATAERELKDISDSGDHDLAALAKMALAGLYRNTNRVPQAIGVYKDLVDHPTNTVTKATAQLALADAYEDSKQPGEAAKLYADIQKSDPQSAAAQLAAQRMAAAPKQ